MSCQPQLVLIGCVLAGVSGDEALDGELDGPRPGRLALDVVETVPLLQRGRQVEAHRRGQETQHVEHVGLAGAVRPDENIQRAKRQVNRSQRTEVPRLDARDRELHA